MMSIKKSQYSIIATYRFQGFKWVWKIRDRVGLGSVGVGCHDGGSTGHGGTLFEKGTTRAGTFCNNKQKKKRS